MIDLTRRSDCAPRVAARFRLLLVGMTLVYAPAAARGEDPWTPGFELPAWKSIDRLQKYPYPDAAPVPDFAALCRDREPLVRAAACMAIGREADPRRLPLLVPLLQDSSPIVRKFALAALLRLDTSEIKGPLLEVLGTWEELTPPLAVGGNQALGLARLGLPNWLVGSNTSLADRRRWLAEFDASQWRMTFPTPQHDLTGDDGRTTVWLTIPAAELDADSQIRLRIVIRRHGGTHAVRGRLHEVGVLREIQFDDLTQLKLVPIGEPLVKDLEVNLPPEATHEYDVLAGVSRGKLLPGVYLLEAGQADWPLFVRIRRSRQTQDEIPKLISQATDVKAIKRLRDERVQAAVHALLGVFTANAHQNNFQAADALARIGDPRAVPVMLQFPRMTAGDSGVDTYSALSRFGEAGDDEYSRCILDWKSRLDDDADPTLQLSLKLLSSRGTREVDSARLELTRTLAQSITNDQTNQNYRRLGILRSALPAMAQKHPQELTDALWTLRDRPQVWAHLLNEFRLERSAWSSQIVVGLYERAAAEGDEATRGIVLEAALRQSPEEVLMSKSPLATIEEALTLIRWTRMAPQTLENTIARLEKFLAGNPHVGLQLGLAHLYSLRDDSAKAEPLWRSVVDSAAAPDDDKASAHCSLGEWHSQRGDPASAKRHWEAALALMKPNTAYGWSARTPEQVQRSLGQLSDSPQLAGAMIELQRMPSMIEINEDVVLADRCAFYLDPSRRLRRWDLRNRSEGTFGVMPNPVRQVAPLDRQHVLVLFKDGTSWMYREGERKPLWEGPDRIPHFSHLTLSKDVISIADESGVLYALHPRDGTTLWKGSCHVRNDAAPPPQDAQPADDDNDPFAGGLLLVPITGYRHPTSSRFVRQVGPLLLLPEKAIDPRRFRCLNLKDGSQQSQFEVGFDVISMAADGDLAILAGAGGQVAAVSLREGKVRWETKIESLSLKSEHQLNTAWMAAGKVAYVSAEDRLFALDAQSGRIRWSWTWTPAGNRPRTARGSGPYSRMIPLADRLIWTVDWDSGRSPGGGPAHHTDVVVLASTGKRLLHQTSPQSAARMSVASPYSVVIDKALFVRFDQIWESWPIPPVDPTEAGPTPP
jgi:HEAT repeat protein